jgi:hypothetical protein
MHKALMRIGPTHKVERSGMDDTKIYDNGGRALLLRKSS